MHLRAPPALHDTKQLLKRELLAFVRLLQRAKLVSFMIACRSAKATDELQVRGAEDVERLSAVNSAERHPRHHSNPVVLLHDATQGVIDLQARDAVVHGLLSTGRTFERRSPSRAPVTVQDALQTLLAEAMRAWQNARVLEKTAAYWACEVLLQELHRILKWKKTSI